MSAWPDHNNENEIAQLRAQVEALSRENGALRQSQGITIGEPTEATDGSGSRNRRRGGGGRDRDRDGGRGRVTNSAASAEREPTGGEDFEGRSVWVSADSTPQSVAKSITGAAMPSARQGFPVKIFAKYDQNCNTAIKAVVSAQRILAQRYEMFVGVTPSFRGNRNELTLTVAPLEGGRQPPHVADPLALEAAPQLSVARGTDPKILAGAIAGQARAGKLLTVRAIGPKAVYEMLRAVGVARAYLADDGKGQDLECFPDFVEVQLEGRAEATNALRLVVAMTLGSPVTEATSVYASVLED